MELSMLPNVCLRSIFLRLPIVDRVQSRKVCKRWREISDDCWRETKTLSVSRDGEWHPTTIVGDCTSMIVLPSTPKFFNELAKRCAPYITTLRDLSEWDYPISLPQIDVIYKRLRMLQVSVCSRQEDLRVSKLFLRHCKIESLNIAFAGNRKCLGKLCTSYLTELIISMKCLDDFDNLELMIPKTEEKLRSCKSLKTFKMFGFVSDEIVRLASRNIHLRDLTINGQGTARYLLTPVGLNCIANLTCLTKIDLSLNGGRLITRQLLEILTTHCLDLESVRLSVSISVNDEDLLLLLRLRKLRSLTIRAMLHVSGKYLYKFSNIETITLERTWVDNAAVTAILRNVPNLKYLDVTFNLFPTIVCLFVAAEEVEKRTNNTPLVLKAKREFIRTYQSWKLVPPLLQLDTEPFLKCLPSHFL